MPKKDFSQIAFDVVQRATGEAPEPASEPISPRKAASQKGGLSGGVARAAKLTTEQRSAIAKIAATKRWAKKQ